MTNASAPTAEGRDITREAFHASVTLDEWYLCVRTNEPPTPGRSVLLRLDPYSVQIPSTAESHHPSSAPGNSAR